MSWLWDRHTVCGGVKYIYELFLFSKVYTTWKPLATLLFNIASKYKIHKNSLSCFSLHLSIKYHCPLYLNLTVISVYMIIMLDNNLYSVHTFVNFIPDSLQVRNHYNYSDFVDIICVETNVLL